MPVYFDGEGEDLTNLSVPDLYLNIESPPEVNASGVATNRIGLVGIASWGPVNSPTSIGSWAAFKKLFGTVQNRSYDMATYAYIGAQMGVQHLRCVRVTDGTDVAASVTILTNCLTITSKYTGSLANADTVTVAAGTAPSSYKVTISRTGLTPETFDNITGSGNALWVAIAAAINNGQSSVRGASALVTATAGSGTTVPASASYTLSGGTDGVSGVTKTNFIGVDTAGARTGMYALRGTDVALFALCDVTDASTRSAQLAFAKSELCQAVCVSAAGDTIANFASVNSLDDAWIKIILGDWWYWYDPVNDLTRLVSPQALYLGEKIAVGVQNSVLNKDLSAIVVGTQSSYANTVYSDDELEAIAAARGDVVCKPCPGGDYFGFRFGRNASSSQVKHQDNYTTLTDYLAKTLQTKCGKYVGRLITSTERAECKAELEYFLESLWTAGYIGFSDDTTTQPYSVAVTAGTAGSGVQNAVVKVRYFDVNEYFIVDLTAGASVTIASSNTAS